MKKILFLFIILLTGQSFAKKCPYPADPINWIMKYCAYKIETDDEIAIQESSCYKSSEKDENSKNPCEINKKYKLKYCTEHFKSKLSEYKSAQDCLKDPAIEPFFAGG